MVIIFKISLRKNLSVYVALSVCTTTDRETEKCRKCILNFYDLMATPVSMFQRALIISREEVTQQSKKEKQMPALTSVLYLGM